MINKNGSTIRDETKSNYLIKDGNFYSKNEYNKRSLDNNFPPITRSIKKMRDKEKLSNEITELFSNEILKNYKNRQNLAMFINDIFNNILNKYQKTRIISNI